MLTWMVAAARCATPTVANSATQAVKRRAMVAKAQPQCCAVQDFCQVQLTRTRADL